MSKLTNESVIKVFNRQGQQTTAKGGDKYSPNFKMKELACQGTGIIKVQYGFGFELECLRVRVEIITGRGFVVNSCCRSPVHNKNVGGHKNSLHLTDNPKHPTEGTMAIDISVDGWTMVEVTVLLECARDLNWSIGHGYDILEGKIKGFVHLDKRTHIGLERKEFYYS